MAQFMKWLLGHKINFTAASPTNKAARNLARLAKENDLYSVEVTTVAKLLGQQPELNEDSGKEEFVTNDSSIGSYQVVIIDEFSMISKANFEDITWEAKYSDTKIVDLLLSV
ncbi:MAG: AAA family ATPase [Xenococcaceae cyanobacterium MO_167.B27]|nr:AAA family ATPase [Xenococcaceae cyanobacterium MO_167.B27]